MFDDYDDDLEHMRETRRIQRAHLAKFCQLPVPPDELKPSIAYRGTGHGNYRCCRCGYAVLTWDVQECPNCGAWDTIETLFDDDYEPDEPREQF